jgi:hypothetical protein
VRFGYLTEISVASALPFLADSQVDPLLSDFSNPTLNIRAIAANSLSSIVPCFERNKFDEIMVCLFTETTE